jgi:hypothetical protein
MHTNLSKLAKKSASTNKYVSQNQLTICGFKTPFKQQELAKIAGLN